MTDTEIQVGEYIRTTNKGIKRIDRIEDNKTVNKYLYFIGYDHNDKEYGVIKTTEIINHDFDIKKLIEVGDYVNGYKVVGVHCKGDAFDCVTVGTEYDDANITIYKDNFKTIATKEQFKSIEYGV